MKVVLLGGPKDGEVIPYGRRETRDRIVIKQLAGSAFDPKTPIIVYTYAAWKDDAGFYVRDRKGLVIFKLFATEVVKPDTGENSS